MKRSFVALFAIILCTSCSYIYSNNLKFDGEQWKQAGERTRGRMAYDLVDSKLLVGKNIKEVEELLGKDHSNINDHITYSIDIGEIVGGHYLNVIFDKKTGKASVVYIGD